LCELDRNLNHDEFTEAEECFLRGFAGQIVKIERVENKELYAEYVKVKRKIEAKNNGDANEMLLKHGTRESPPEIIWKSSKATTGTEGFDFRYSGAGMFGRGSYFAEDTSYSHTYKYTLPTGEFQMFLASVAVGKIDQRQAADGRIAHPAAAKDSVRGPITSSNQGIIVYELNRAYPKYLITYTYEDKDKK